MRLENGKTYDIIHSRKGAFRVFVESQSEEFASGIVVSGKANAILDYNVSRKGDQVDFRKSFLKSAVEVK